MLAGLLIAPAAAQTPSDSMLVRPLATRADLEALAQRFAAVRDQDRLDRVRARLRDGDFHPGDLILLEVQGEATLSDTFAVGASGALVLPSPTTGTMPLHGVLRAELPDSITRYLTRFLESPVVQARSLVRLSIQGEVSHAGVYGVPTDAKLGDALMAAGGMTQFADMKKLRIERGGERVWSGHSLEQTVDRLSLQDGDQIVVGSRRSAGVGGDLRFVWLIISIAGGVFALSRHF